MIISVRAGLLVKKPEGMGCKEKRNSVFILLSKLAKEFFSVCGAGGCRYETEKSMRAHFDKVLRYCTSFIGPLVGPSNPCHFLIQVNHAIGFVYIRATAGKIVHITLNAWQESCWPVNTYQK